MSVSSLQTRIDQLQGADPGTLETKVRQYYGTDEAGDDDNTVAGHVSKACVQYLN